MERRSSQSWTMMVSVKTIIYRKIRCTCTRLNLELSIFYALATASIFSTLSVIISFLTVFLLHTAMMASFNKEQLPAQRTKIVDHSLGPLKAGPTRLCVPVCNHDAASSKPFSVGRDVVDIHQQTKCDCVVNVCGSKLCKTCKHVHECSTFRSNVTHKTYKIVSPSLSMNCGTKNII